MAKKTERRLLAEKIAAEKGIKVKSAMRYLQRAAAPVGKQRIAKPTFRGLLPATKEKAIRAVERAKPDVPGAGGFVKRDRYEPGRKHIVSIKGRFKISKEYEERTINLYLSAAETRKVINAGGRDDSLRALLAAKDAHFLDESAVLRTDEIFVKQSRG